VVKELLQYIKRDKGEADKSLYINICTVKGESALHYAAKLRHDAIDESDRTPGATKEQQVGNTGKEIAKLLLDGGASVSKPTKDVRHNLL